ESREVRHGRCSFPGRWRLRRLRSRKRRKFQRAAAATMPAISEPGAKYQMRGVRPDARRLRSRRELDSLAWNAPNESVNENGFSYVMTLQSSLNPASFLASAMASSR